MTPNSLPPVPVPPPLPDSWAHRTLYENVQDAIKSLPAYFRTEAFIAGVAATDLHTLNTMLGVTIEDQVVQTLNSMRPVWDAQGRYSLYSFVRQSQTFPDVRLQKPGNPPDILLGIELKGWYVLAKEAEPSLRFTATAAVCNPWDMIVVVPWVLSQVISGNPICYEPYIASAQFAAEYRNHHWQHIRRTNSNKSITIAPGVSPYPQKSDAISDKAAADNGKNFGRIARTGIMDTYFEKTDQVQLSGVRVEHWRGFFKAFTDKATEEQIRETLSNIADQIASSESPATLLHSSILKILNELKTIAGIEVEEE